MSEEFDMEKYQKSVKRSITEIQKRLRTLEKPTKETADSPKLDKDTSTIDEKHSVEHWKTDFIDLDCPECVAELGKTHKKLYDSSEFICSDCGFPLGDEKHVRETEECPSCKGKDARRSRKD